MCVCVCVPNPVGKPCRRQRHSIARRCQFRLRSEALFSPAAFLEALIGSVAQERNRVGMLVSSCGVAFPVGAAKTGKPLSAARVESAVTCLRTQVASVHMGVRVVAVSVLQLLLATAPAAGEWLRGTLCARCAPATCCRPA